MSEPIFNREPTLKLVGGLAMGIGVSWLIGEWQNWLDNDLAFFLSMLLFIAGLFIYGLSRDLANASSYSRQSQPRATSTRPD
jgi:hypothetical protein